MIPMNLYFLRSKSWEWQRIASQPSDSDLRWHLWQLAALMIAWLPFACTFLKKHRKLWKNGSLWRCDSVVVKDEEDPNWTMQEWRKESGEHPCGIYETPRQKHGSFIYSKWCRILGEPSNSSVSCFKPRFALIFDDATFGSFNCF